MNVYREIMEWSKELPDWQRDVLRRLVTKTEFSEDDFLATLNLCKQSNGIPNDVEGELSLDPLSERHVPQEAQNDESISLISITDVNNVNAIADSASLNFSLGTLNIIYGDNGSGKSGYVRILKQVCRARGGFDPIAPNVFNEANDVPPSAKIKYQNNETPCLIEFLQGVGVETGDLSKISVFDSDIAHTYIKEKHDVAFLPLGLDLLPRLANAVSRIGEIMRGELGQLETNKLSQEGFHPETMVGKFLTNLDVDTEIGAVDTLSEFSDTDKVHLKNLTQRLSKLKTEDPKVKVGELRVRGSRARKVYSVIELVDNYLSNDPVARISDLKKDYKTKLEAVNALSVDISNKSPLPGIGDKVWRTLWEAARRYSEGYAYPERDFPVIENDARCVLCHQELDNNARKRLTDFERFVSDEVQASADEIKILIEKDAENIQGIISSVDMEDETIQEIEIHYPALGKQLRSHLQDAGSILRVLKEFCFIDMSILVKNVAGLAETKEAVGTIIRGMEREADEYDLTKESSASIDEIEKELCELKDRQKLNEMKGKVVEEIKRQKMVASYKTCISEASSRRITDKAKELTQRMITEKLQNKFEEEVERIGLRSINIRMEAASGQRGVLYHQISLCDAQTDHALNKILSEGEYRAIALAAFLTEIATAPGNPAIVIDDPVTSLDHICKENIALRFVQESRSRQVVVFTHDIDFLMLLLDAAKKEGCSFGGMTVKRAGPGTGISQEGLPWQGMNTGRRIAYIRKKLQEARTLYNDGSLKYEQEGELIYEKLRETWERAVEEVLLGGIVERLRPNVQTQQIQSLSDITQNDCSIVTTNMSRCSSFLHDQAMGHRKPIPPPETINEDIEGLYTWVQELHKRRRAL